MSDRDEMDDVSDEDLLDDVDDVADEDGVDEVVDEVADDTLRPEAQPAGGGALPLDPPEDPGEDWRSTKYALWGITVLGLVLRLADLGGRPLHHDESIDAHFSELFVNGTYQGYDPVYHGPIRFYIEGGFFKLFGQSLVTARLLAALSGTILILLPWFWRRNLGRAGTIAASAILCVSPSFLYFTRFGREDAFFALLTLAFAMVLFALVSRPRSWMPVAAGLLLAAAWALKESVLINLLVLGSFLLVLAMAQLVSAARPQADAARIHRGFLLGGIALMIGTFAYGERVTTWLRQAKVTQICDPPRDVSPDSLAWGIGVTAVLLVVGVLATVVLARRSGVVLAEVPVIRALVAPGAVAWLVAAGVTALFFSAMFTTFFTNLDGEPGDTRVVDVCDEDTVNDTNPVRWSGVVDGLIGGFEYWSGEQETLRGDNRWFYYLVLIPAYEWLAVGLAFIGGARALRRMWLVDQVALWWAMVGVAAYSYAGERMPWLVIHPLLPIVVLAGLGAQVLWERRRDVALLPVAALGAIGVAYTLYASFAVNYHRGADAREMFVQAAQAGQDVPAMVDRIERLDRISWAARGEGITVGIADEVYWLWWFYFTEETAVQGQYVVITEDGPPDPTLDVLLVPDEDEPIVDALGTYTAEPFRHRVWWSEVTDWSDGGMSGWIRWLWDRRTWTPTEGLDGSVYISNELVDLERRSS